MKNISFYQYETAKIHILWDNKIQPFGYFKKAIDAFNYIEKISISNTTAFKIRYSIYTPDGIINLKF